MRRTLSLAQFLLLFLAVLPAAAYDINGVGLGGRELDAKRAFPSAHCKPLEWKSDAADRRCDDAQVSVGGIQARVTVFMRADVIQALDVRFDIKDLERVKELLRARWGAPLAENTETVSVRNKEDRKVYKARWEKGADRAILTAQLEKKRATLEISRGGFADEIYRVR
jgi:hypothetical protein